MALSPEVVLGKVELLQSCEPLEAVHVDVHQHGGPVGVVRLEAKAFKAGKAGKGSGRNVSDLAEVDGQLLQVGQRPEVFGLELGLVEEHVGTLEVEHLGGIHLLQINILKNIFFFVADGRLK